MSNYKVIQFVIFLNCLVVIYYLFFLSALNIKQFMIFNMHEVSFDYHQIKITNAHLNVKEQSLSLSIATNYQKSELLNFDNDYQMIISYENSVLNCQKQILKTKNIKLDVVCHVPSNYRFNPESYFVVTLKKWQTTKNTQQLQEQVNVFVKQKYLKRSYV